MNRFQIFKTDSTKYFTIIPKNSVDLIICDLPYGITGLKWDQVIDMDKFWRMVSWVSKTKTPTLLFGSEPFSSKQRISNLADYKYDWVWEKNRTSNFLQAKFEPRRIHENISVFYKQRPTYNPQMVEMSESSKKRSQRIRGARSIPEGSIYERFQTSERKEPKTHAYPTNIIKFNLEQNNQHSKKVFHPTQKPVALLEYLIKTYSNPGDTVLDFTMGSGSTGVAAILNDRNFIGFEIEEDFFNVAKERLAEACSQVPIGPSDQTI